MWENSDPAACFSNGDQYTCIQWQCPSLLQFCVSRWALNQGGITYKYIGVIYYLNLPVEAEYLLPFIPHHSNTERVSTLSRAERLLVALAVGRLCSCSKQQVLGNTVIEENIVALHKP